MKNKLNILLVAVMLFAGLGLASCSDDEFTPSIFDTTDYPLDRHAETFPLDTFVKKNFLEPYNLRYLYKMQDIGSDMQKNLVPCTYQKSVQLAALNKYLWYDVYKKWAGDDFLKEYSPRIIHVIGSPAYNPTSGTVTLGTAEGGLKITLYNANNIDLSDIDNLNEYFFKTMHHEFGHILHQNHLYPTSFGEISKSSYHSSDWQDIGDSVAVAQGFASPYGSSQVREDWVEILANYIVKDSITWNTMLHCATFDWEDVDYSETDYEKLNQKVLAGIADRDSVGYGHYTNSGEFKVQRKVISRDANGYASGGKIEFLERDGIDGKAVILQKLKMVKEWLMTYFSIDLDKLRNEVQSRQYVTNPDGSFKVVNGRLVNRLTTPLESDPTKTLMDSLVSEVDAYKALMVK